MLCQRIEPGIDHAVHHALATMPSFSCIALAYYCPWLLIHCKHS
jgi:hypothetical protein